MKGHVTLGSLFSIITAISRGKLIAEAICLWPAALGSKSFSLAETPDNTGQCLAGGTHPGWASCSGSMPGQEEDEPLPPTPGIHAEVPRAE